MNKYSPHKIFRYPEKIKAMLDGELTPPICVRIKPTNICQMRCSFSDGKMWCVYAKGSGMHDLMEKDVMDYDKLKSILIDLKGMGVKSIILSGGGSPLLHPRIKDILWDLIRFDFEWAVITNGEMIIDYSKLLSYAKWIRVSADYWDATSFSASRKRESVKLTKILDGIASLNNVGINFIVTKENYQYLEDATYIFKNAGAKEIRFSPVWVDNFEEYHSFPVNIDGCKKFEDENFKVYSSYYFQSSERGYSRCFSQEFVPVIGADLNIYRCHNTSFSEHGLIGSIKDRNFSDVWKKENIQFDAHVCRHQCANDKKNILLNEIADSSLDSFA